MPQTTVSTLITSAMRWAGIVGAGENPTQDELNDALVRLNAIIGQLSANGVTIPEVARISFSASGFEKYQLTGRPIAVLGLQLSTGGLMIGYRKVDPTSYSNHLMDFVFTYDASASSPAIYVRPSATSGTYYLWALNPLTEYDQLSSTVALPPGYYHLLTVALGVDLATEYGRPVSDAMYREYQEALAAARAATIANIAPEAEAGGEKK